MSILSQTYADFELIVIDDGSTDYSVDIVASFSDPRIYFYTQENRGLAATLNRGISLAQGAYIARQDQDDVSLPQRFEKQVAFLESHLDYGMVGTWAEIWTEDGPSGRVHQHPAESPLLKVELLFTNPFVHSSMMIRRSCLDKVGGYTNDPSRHPPEDYELWSRIARHHEIANIPETLVVYREVGGSMSRVADRQFWERVVTICSENIFYMLDKECDIATARGVARLVHCVDYPTERPDIKDVRNTMRNVSNIVEHRYPKYRNSLRKLLETYCNLMIRHHRSFPLRGIFKKPFNWISRYGFLNRKGQL